MCAECRWYDDLAFVTLRETVLADLRFGCWPVSIAHKVYAPSTSPKLKAKPDSWASACVVDCLIQEALLQQLTPIFDPLFSDYSYGFRPGRRAHQSIETACDHVAAGHR
jgi:retron-type reverse transcriptase